jgi:toxin ParE1/3/4
MEVEIFWSNEAKTDLAGIFEYYAEVANFNVAQKLTETLIKATLQLKQMPKMGAKEPLFAHRQQEYRYLVKGNYKIVYYPVSNAIIITHIFDCRQNPTKMKK